ncbi:MAG: hypothetical protein ACRD8U_02240 [Pyrinomonadaceae bacterium]
MLLYNLGVLLDDMGCKNGAMEAYEAALRGNLGLADCKYNLAPYAKTSRNQRKPSGTWRSIAG